MYILPYLQDVEKVQCSIFDMKKKKSSLKAS